jgi:molybdopterin-guanine dinucleotide biosynthesis protein A
MTLQKKVSGLILAGGQAKRLNYQPKGLMLFHNRPLIDYVFNAIRPVVDDLWISANQHQASYEQWNVDIISDDDSSFAGPLAGLLAGMRHVHCSTILTVPCDAPFIATDQLEWLVFKHFQHKAEITVACTGKQVHGVFLVAQTNLSSHLSHFLATDHHKVKDWLAHHNTHYVDFGEQTRGFENLNTFDDFKTFLSL